jgi:hypothetical protein
MHHSNKKLVFLPAPIGFGPWLFVIFSLIISGDLLIGALSSHQKMECGIESPTACIALQTILVSIGIAFGAIALLVIRNLLDNKKNPPFIELDNVSIYIGKSFFLRRPVRIKLCDVTGVHPYMFVGRRRIKIFINNIYYTLDEASFEKLRDFYFVIKVLARGQQVTFNRYPRRSKYWKDAYYFVVYSTVFLLVITAANYFVGNEIAFIIKILVTTFFFFFIFGGYTYYKYKAISNDPKLDLEMEDLKD